jgi:AmiR/NasT family two-component response regulator
MTHVIAQPVDAVLAQATTIVMAQYETSAETAVLLIALAAVNRTVNVAVVVAQVIADRSLTVSP